MKVQSQKIIVQLNLFASCSPYEACDEESPHSCCSTNEGHAYIAFCGFHGCEMHFKERKKRN